jgi:ATP synthase protein I
LHQCKKNSYTQLVCRKEEILMTDSAAEQVQKQRQAEQVQSVPVVLTEAELAQINARARGELMQVVFAQALSAVVVALLAWFVGGSDAGWSALAGSGTYFIPNVLFALRLFLATFRPSGSSALLFIVGEFLKVGATVGLLWLLAHVGGERVVWLAVIAGLIAALKGYMLVLMFGKRTVARPTNS